MSTSSELLKQLAREVALSPQEQALAVGSANEVRALVEAL